MKPLQDAAGCSWCEVELEVDPDHMSPTFVPLRRPHCAAQHVCHGGAVGRASPYADYARSKLLRGHNRQGNAIFHNIQIEPSTGCPICMLMNLGWVDFVWNFFDVA